MEPEDIKNIEDINEQPVESVVPNATANQPVSVWTSGGVQHQKDELVTEVPVALVYNGISHAVMMATPQELQPFAIGFSLSERIVKAASDIYDIEIDASDAAGVQILLTVSAESFSHLKDRRRSLSGRTGCGLCGAESLQQVCLPVDPIDSCLKISHHSVDRACRELEQHQPLQSLTGGLHAAAWCNLQGELVRVYEDVGRHNALDKLIGWLAQTGSTDYEQSPENGFLLMSSRASYEIVQKAAISGIALLAAVSAPTSFAVEIAERANITLIGFTRANRHVVYTQPQRLID